MTQQPPPGTFAERLAKARDVAGASRVQVGAAAGVSEYTVGAWERGEEGNPTLASLAGISVFLGVSVDWLVHGPRTVSAEERARLAAAAAKAARRNTLKKKAAGD